VDCDDIALLLAAGGKTLTTLEDQQVHDHVVGCETCRELATEARDERFRWVARIPEDALDDPDLLVLPVVDPIVFGAATEIARGGMGKVSRVHDRRLGRNVAIKEVLVTGLRARFEREVAITAKLQHPAIVPVYEAGSWPSGTAFYTMRLVSGGTLAEAIARTTTLEQRLALLPHVTALTDAIAYAHSRRIVHRDLKPGNVLVGEFGETVVIDWGLAKELDVDTAEGIDTALAATGANLTVVGSVMGTPGYMAPEQAAGDELDERCDVYALGAILYTMLSGKPPHWDTDTKPTPEMLVELARVRPPVPLRELVPDVPTDLHAIVERAMARDLSERFASAKEMAEELRRFQAGRLLRSRDYSLRDLVVRWVRQHRAVVTVGAIALAVIAVVGIVAITRVARARDTAERALAESQLEQGRQLLVAGNADQAAPLIAAAMTRLPDDATARRLDALARRDDHRRVASIPGTTAAVSSDGRVLAIGRRDGSIALVDGESGSIARTLPAHGGPIIDLAIAADAGHLLVATGTGAWLVDARTGTISATLTAAAIGEARFVDADRVILAGKDGVQLAGTTGAAIATRAFPEPRILDISRDGAAILVHSGDAVHVVSARDLSSIAQLPHGDHTFDAQFDRDGGVVTAADDGGSWWSLSPVREIKRIPWAFSLAFVDDTTVLSGGTLVDLHADPTGASPDRAVARDVTIQCNAAIDSHHAITAGYDRVIRIWDLDRNALPAASMTASSAVSRVMVARGGRRAISIGSGADAQIELWDITSLPAPTTVATQPGPIDHVIADPSGRLVIRWDGAHTTLLAPRAIQLAGWPMAFRPHADEVITDLDGKLTIWSASDGHELRTIAEAAPIYHVAFSPAGDVVVTDAGAASHHVDVRSAADWKIRGGFEVPPGISALGFDGDHIATGHDDGAVQIWNAQTGALVRATTGHTAHVESIAIRGSTMITTGWDQTTRRWSFPSGDALEILPTGHHKLVSVAVAPDGASIAIADGTASIGILDNDRGRLIQRLPTREPPTTIVFTDADHVVAGDGHGRLERFDLRVSARP